MSHDVSEVLGPDWSVTHKCVQLQSPTKAGQGVNDVVFNQSMVGSVHWSGYQDVIQVGLEICLILQILGQVGQGGHVTG